MIKVKIENTIVDILKEISMEKSNEIILDFPFGHPVLHNYLSLKIIQTKTRNKNLFIVSNDKTARKIGRVLGIKFIKNKNSDKKNGNITTEDILKENYTFIEYAVFEIKLFFGNIKGNINRNKKINSVFYFTNKYGNTNKNIIFYFLLILAFIFIILLYIYYFAINKTYITIYPEISVESKLKNINFIENYIETDRTDSINNKVNIDRISKNVNISKKIRTSGIKQKANNISKGEVVFYNYLDEEVLLLKNTTLENDEGTKFILPDNIKISGSKIDNNGKRIPGESNKIIFGKVTLLNGNYSGTKTNIGTGVLLTIPKLKNNKTKIFAKSITKFRGGSDDFINFLTKEDLENAKKLIYEDLKNTAISEIKEDLEKENKNNNIKKYFLPIDNIFKFKDIEYKLPENIRVGDAIEDFSISGKINIYSFVYNKEAVISILKKSINEFLIKDFQKIISIDDKTLRISHVIKRNDLVKRNGYLQYIDELSDNFVVKGTTEIEYNVSKILDNNDNIFFDKIKQLILGLEIEKAEKILTNRPEINNVEIKVKPFFLKYISQLPENVEIIIEN